MFTIPFIFSSVASGVAGPTYSETILADSPVNYWRLDETSGSTASDEQSVTDLPHVNSPTVGQTTDVVGGNTAYTFDGTNRLTYTGTYNPGATGSIELWFNTSNTTIYNSLWGGHNGGSGYMFCFFQANGAISIQHYISSISVVTTTSTGWNDGAWHHLVITQDGAGFDIYIDGALQGVTGNYNVWLSSVSTNTFHVGGSITGSSDQRYFTGSLDEVAVYGYVLTTDQITNHFLLGTGYNPYGVFNSTSDTLTRTTGSTTEDRRKFTISGWFKIDSFGTTTQLYKTSGYNAASNIIQMHSTGTKLYVQHRNWGASYIWNSDVNYSFSAGTWYHIMEVIDTTQATAADRVKVYINGTYVPRAGGNNPGLNAQLDIYINETIEWMASETGSVAHLVCVDGQALSYSDFVADNKPKDLSALTFGNQGSWLKLQGDATDSSGNGNDFTASSVDYGAEEISHA